MKVLLALVTVIAVYTTDGQPDRETAHEDQNYHEELNGQDEAEHFQDGSDGNNYDVIEDSTKQVRLMKERTLLTDDETQDQVFADPVKIATQGSNLEEIEEQHKLKLRKTKPKCKANIACLVMGGFCVTNTSLCSGRLVPEGCKKRNCQCCVPGTIEAKIDNLKEDLQSLKENLSSELQSLKINTNNSNSNINSELQSIKVDMNNSNSNITSELQSLKINTNNINSNLNSELQSIKVDMNNSNSNINSELQSLKVNMNNSNSNLNSELQSIKVNMNNSNSNLNSELQSLKVDMKNSNSNLSSDLQSHIINTNKMNTSLNSKLDSLLQNQAIPCPNGLFRFNTSNQCFKFFNESSMSWTAAKEKCHSEGLALAKPENPVELRRYLVLNYGDKRAWLGGRGTGSTINWDRDGTTLSSSNPAWWPGYPGGYTSSSRCLILLSRTYHLNSEPNNPYAMYSCTASYYPLCELIMG